MTFRIDSIQKKKQGSSARSVKVRITQGYSNNSYSLQSDTWKFSKCFGQLGTQTSEYVIPNDFEDSTRLHEFLKDGSDKINNLASLRPLKPATPISYPTVDELDNLEHNRNANSRLGGGSWATLWRQHTCYTEGHDVDLSNDILNIEDPDLRYQMGLLSIAGSCIECFTHSNQRQTTPNLRTIPELPPVQNKSKENRKRQQGKRSLNSVTSFGAKADCSGTFTAKETAGSNNAVICVVGRQQKFSDISKLRNFSDSNLKTIGGTMLPILRTTPLKKTTESPSQFADPMKGANGTFRDRIQTLLYLEETTKRWERSRWRRKMKRRRSRNANRAST